MLVLLVMGALIAVGWWFIDDFVKENRLQEQRAYVARIRAAGGLPPYYAKDHANCAFVHQIERMQGIELTPAQHMHHARTCPMGPYYAG